MPLDKNSFLIDLSESEHTDFGRADFAGQPEPQKVFSAIWALESQVNSGGFLQYFASSDGDTANYASTALRAIGANRCADIVERALKVASPTALPESQDARDALVESLGGRERDEVDALDSKFFEYPDNLTELLFAYVASHPETFGAVPDEKA
jgi:hypothetical protein